MTTMERSIAATLSPAALARRYFISMIFNPRFAFSNLKSLSAKPSACNRADRWYNTCKQWLFDILKSNKSAARKYYPSLWQGSNRSFSIKLLGYSKGFCSQYWEWVALIVGFLCWVAATHLPPRLFLLWFYLSSSGFLSQALIHLNFE